MRPAQILSLTGMLRRGPAACLSLALGATALVTGPALAGGPAAAATITATVRPAAAGGAGHGQRHGECRGGTRHDPVHCLRAEHGGLGFPDEHHADPGTAQAGGRGHAALPGRLLRRRVQLAEQHRPGRLRSPRDGLRPVHGHGAGDRRAADPHRQLRDRHPAGGGGLGPVRQRHQGLRRQVLGDRQRAVRRRHLRRELGGQQLLRQEPGAVRDRTAPVRQRDEGGRPVDQDRGRADPAGQLAGQRGGLRCERGLEPAGAVDRRVGHRLRHRALLPAELPGRVGGECPRSAGRGTGPASPGDQPVRWRPRAGHPGRDDRDRREQLHGHPARGAVRGGHLHDLPGKWRVHRRLLGPAQRRDRHLHGARRRDRLRRRGRAVQRGLRGQHLRARR